MKTQPKSDKVLDNTKVLTETIDGTEIEARGFVIAKTYQDENGDKKALARLEFNGGYEGAVYISEEECDRLKYLLHHLSRELHNVNTWRYRLEGK